MLFLILICRQPVAFLIKPIPCFCNFLCYVAGILKLYLLGKMIKILVPQTDFYRPTPESILPKSRCNAFCQNIKDNLHILICLHILWCRCAVAYGLDRSIGILNLYRGIIIAIGKCPEDASHLS